MLFAKAAKSASAGVEKSLRVTFPELDEFSGGLGEVGREKLDDLAEEETKSRDLDDLDDLAEDDLEGLEEGISMWSNENCGIVSKTAEYPKTDANPVVLEMSLSCQIAFGIFNILARATTCIAFLAFLVFSPSIAVFLCFVSLGQPQALR